MMKILESALLGLICSIGIILMVDISTNLPREAVMIPLASIITIMTVVFVYCLLYTPPENDDDIDNT
jgi:hypothetical protein